MAAEDYITWVRVNRLRRVSSDKPTSLKAVTKYCKQKENNSPEAKDAKGKKAGIKEVKVAETKVTV